MKSPVTLKLQIAALLISLTQLADAAISRSQLVLRKYTSFLLVGEDEEQFGSKDCPCIGFDGIKGDTVAVIRGKEVTFPADLGGSCEAWDEPSSPECKVEGAPEWCGRKWCYVDPRNCRIPELPQMSSYQPMATYQNMALHWSYSTCDSKAVAPEAAAAGMFGCRCIGFDNAPGVIMAQIGEHNIEYPAETGGQCQAWDDGRNPECQGDKPPAWCKQKWCFVDPCSCNLEVSPKVSDYLGKEATYQGKQVYYSYATCGEKDSYSSNEKVREAKEAIEDTCTSTAVGFSFGKEECPCIGFSDVEGDTVVKINKTKVKYPADLGGSCAPWDDDLHPSCSSDEDDAPEWCKSEWCYVDPRKCNLKVLPKMAPADTSYQPKAMYQELPLYYSYSTCRSEDTWAANVTDVGIQGCRCIGFAGSPGTTKVAVDGKELDYPAEVGGQCKAWDSGRHPKCAGKDPPDWCLKEWCFVDPCSCNAEAPPKISNYLGSATFQGRQVYYSYAACEETDSYSTKEKVEASKAAIAKTCAEKDYREPKADFNYNQSQYKKEWHNEWREGDYPEWDGVDDDEVPDDNEDSDFDDDDDDDF